MRSIKGSKFFTIDSGEQISLLSATIELNNKADSIRKSLNHVMPVKLVKVEIISIDKQVKLHSMNVNTVWLATGLMVKL